MKKGRRIDSQSLELPFCHGKATWYEKPAELYRQCYVAMETGILPSAGGLDNQTHEFNKIFYFFISHWNYRAKVEHWSTVGEIINKVLETLGKMISKMFGGR